MYQILFGILDSTNGYATTALLAGIFVAAPLFIGLLFYGISIAAPPGMQVNYVFKHIAAKRNRSDEKRSATKNIELLENKKHKQQLYEDWVEISYRRLGKTLSFEDFQAESKTIGFYIFIVGIFFGVVLFILAKDLMLTVIFASIGMMGFLFLGEPLNKMMLQNKIKKLNFSQKIELPVLISRFQAACTDIPAHPFNRVLEIYLQHATALKYDIEMTLADRRSYGDTQAMTLWQKRVTVGAGSTMIEFTQFCERLKKLYTTGDSLYVKTELSSDIRIIDTKYVAPFIKKQSDNRLLKLMVIMILTFAILACFMMLPMVIQIYEALKDVSV